MLIINTATGCGFTPQYEGIEKLYEKYHGQGFEVLDFPCNQFMNQAPGSDEEIHSFCTAKYKTRFDQLAKIEVNGENEEPLYSFLKSAQPEEEISGFANKAAMKMMSALSSSTKKAGDIRWNFTKFLVDREGNVVKRFAPTEIADKLESHIKSLL
ncbi:MAG: glutathione peroxidase [Oscillospiraceae bacterium]|nr:glutathione peroxidase [Oscillospiraceae bacterium]